jgi:two-component system sensor kinase FixL
VSGVAPDESDPLDHWIIRLVQATQDAVITIDEQRRIVLFNAAAERMFGYEAEEVHGHNVKILMPDPYRGEHDEYVSRYERTLEPRAIGRIRTVTAQRKNGETFPIELSVTPIAVGDTMRYGAFIRDISETVRLQEQLVDRERLAAIGTTAAKFAHEVSNPINGMFTQAQLLQRRLRGADADERIAKGVDLMMRSLQQLTGLLEEFRCMSRRQDYRFVPTKLEPLCQEILEFEAANYSERYVELDIEFDPDLPAVRADPLKLKQVLVNLCKNAVEAIGSDGRITVRGHVEGPQVVLTIQDTGDGVPEGLDVFAPFATTKREGTGLGLPIVQQIVAAHDGSVSYESVRGEGTVFSLRLPVA